MRAGLRRALTAGFVVAALAAAAYFLWTRRDEVGLAVSRLSPAAALGSLLTGAAAAIATLLAWRRLIADLGVRLPLAAAARVFFIGQLGKYLPGSVWPVLAQMELGRDYQVPRPVSAATASVMLVLGTVTGTGVAAVLLALTDGGLLADYRWIALAAIPLLLLLLPPVQQWLVALAGRVLRRPLQVPRASLRGTAVAAVWLVASWVLFGLHLHLLVVSTCGCAASPALDIGVFALAWVAGFLVVLAPAGAGVREGVLVLGLAPVLEPGAALLVALVSRVALTVADFLLAGAAALGARSGHPRLGSPGGTPPA